MAKWRNYFTAYVKMIDETLRNLHIYVTQLDLNLGEAWRHWEDHNLIL